MADTRAANYTNTDNGNLWPAPGANPTGNLSGGPAIPAGVAVQKLRATGKNQDGGRVYGR